MSEVDDVGDVTQDRLSREEKKPRIVEPLQATATLGMVMQIAIETRTRRRIDLFEQAGEDWRFAESLKSISEDTAQEYEGRAVLELIQNGHDALDSCEPGRIAVFLDVRSGHGVLYVANEGAPFTDRNFKSITEFALSDKGPGEGIGNKGLGFRSVLQLTDWPEVYSKETARSVTFDGYCFRFATPEDLRTLLDDAGLAARVADQVSPLALPVLAQPNDPVLAELVDAGFATVVRLPLRDARAAAAALDQVNEIAAGEAPLLLFLDRIAALTVEVRSGDGQVKQQTLSRSATTSDLVTGQAQDWVKEIDLASAGRYLVGRRVLADDELKDAIARSIQAREVDERWGDWTGEAWVGVALRLDTEQPHGRLYTFLPMSQDASAPLCAHVHAPFFTKLARLGISETVTLNDFLLRQLAVLCVDLARRLRAEAPYDVAARLVLDLVCWDPPGRLDDALDGQLRREPVVPLVGGAHWGTLDESYTWLEQARPWGALTADAIARIGIHLLDTSVGEQRTMRATSLHKALLGTLMHPARAGAASWAERVAAQMRTAGQAGVAPAWAEFYDDLEQAFQSDPDALRGKNIILDQDGELAPALGAPAQPGQRDRTVFFSPSDDGTAGASQVPRDLRALRRRLNFTDPQIAWRRPGRSFLETHQLVREYRADRVFDAIQNLLADTTSDALRRDALVFAFRQFASLNPAQRANLRKVGFFLPKADGTWARATECLLSPGWGTDKAQRLERLLAEGGATVAPLAALRERWINAPEQWPVEVANADLYLEFLCSIGVRDGLMLFKISSRLGECNGADLKPRVLAKQMHLDDRLAQGWAEDVDVNWSGGAHPRTKYTFSEPLVHLSGAPEVATLNAASRRQFAELVLLGLKSWGNNCFGAIVRRPGRQQPQQDAHTWPTPFDSFLRHMPWLPVQDSKSDEPRFVTPSQAWFSDEGELPAFIPAMPLAIRRLIAEERPLKRLRQAGLRLWEEPRNSGALVKELGSILAEGSVPNHLSISFKKHYAKAWAGAAQLATWPWSDGEQVLLAVDHGAGLTVINASDGQKVYVSDEAAPVKESLVALAGHPVLVTEPDAGEAIAQMLQSNGIAITRLSKTEVKIRANGQPVVPSSDQPLLTDGREWLTTVVALVLEMKSGAFIRRSERGIRLLLDRLRAIRVIRATDVEVLIDGVRAVPTTTTRSLPLPDSRHPTVVVWNTEGVWDDMQACAPALSQLLDQPSLQDALELVFIKLQRLLGEEPGDHIDDSALGIALDTTETRITELRRSLTGHLDDLVHLLRPVVVCTSGVDNIEAIDEALNRAKSEDALHEAIKTWVSPDTFTASDLIDSARRSRSLAELRDDVHLDFRAFNAALTALGPPYTPIFYPETHEQVFDEFIREHNANVLDRLREHYSPLAARNGDVGGYAAARHLDGLYPDPAWLPNFRVPPQQEMRSRIGTWLRQHGAYDDLDRPSTLEPVAKLRAWNAESLDRLVPALQPVISAWCRRNVAVVPAPWTGQPQAEAKAALDNSGLSDLLRLDNEQLLNVAASHLGWPLGMPVTGDLYALGLKPEDLVFTHPQAADTFDPSPNRSVITIGDKIITVGSTRLAEIADLAYQTVNDAFLSQSGMVQLNDIEPGGNHQRYAGAQPAKTAIAKMARMSEDQRSAVGLIGEVIAQAWLLRKYSDVRWRSGYAATINGDADASDGYGYDFEIPWRNSSLFYEVKALTDPPRELTEFEMGESEVRVAQECANGNRYRILLVTAVLDPPNRRLYELPSPFSPKGRGSFRVTGRGLRYQCAPSQKG